MFRKDRFVEDCKLAVAEGQSAVRELVAEAVADPSAIIAELGEPTAAGVYPLYHADDLTVLIFVWAPYMTLPPHNHNMFAVIGIYSGREDNMFWRRIDDGAAEQMKSFQRGPERRARCIGCVHAVTIGTETNNWHQLSR